MVKNLKTNTVQREWRLVHSQYGSREAMAPLVQDIAHTVIDMEQFDVKYTVPKFFLTLSGSQTLARRNTLSWIDSCTANVATYEQCH